MPDIKLKLKDLGTLHLMALDASTLFLPFGRPISDYLRGDAGNQNGSKALLKQQAIDFVPEVLWNQSIASLLRTTGFAELEQEGLVKSDPEPADPGVADLLPLESPALAGREPEPASIPQGMAFEDLSPNLPRVSSLPLRLRMTFGPPPQKTSPAPVSKPAVQAPVAKSSPAPVAAPPKPAPVAAPKPAMPTPSSKTAVPAKPVAPIPPAPKPSGAQPASRVSVLQPPAVAAPKPPKPSVPVAPAARAPEINPAPVKSGPIPSRAPISSPARSTENVVTPFDSAALAKSPASPQKEEKTAPAGRSKPLAPPVPPEQSKPVERVEPATARDVIAKEVQETESKPALKAKGGLSNLESEPAVTARPSTFEPNLSAANSAGMLERIPMLVKIGVAVMAIAGGLYFGLGKSSNKPAEESRPISVGEQGWATEWASDTVGSRRARQLTLYRPSAGIADYQFQFVGQIETKAIGWVFRAIDTKNYYAMKLESSRPGSLALTHFAVVDGRESSYALKPLTINSRPGATYKVKLDVTGPRFTVSIQGEPVDFWTDNRLKTGSVGLMNERDERGIASAVQFTFPHVTNK